MGEGREGASQEQRRMPKISEMRDVVFDAELPMISMAASAPPSETARLR